MREILYSRTAQRALTRMPRNRAERIRDQVRAYAADPVSQARNVTSLKGRVGLVRLRAGNWRVIMRDGTVLHILNIAGRGSVYRGETTEERLR